MNDINIEIYFLSFLLCFVLFYLFVLFLKSFVCLFVCFYLFLYATVIKALGLSLFSSISPKNWAQFFERRAVSDNLGSRF